MFKGFEIMKKANIFSLLTNMVLVNIVFASMSAISAQTIQIGAIAAIVNDEVISLYDVHQRTQLFLVTSGIEKNPQTVQQLRGQVLRSLIDEKMQIQAAKDSEITVNQEDINASIKRIANDFGGKVSEVERFLGQNNIALKTLEHQIAAELAWSYFVQRKFGGRVSISQVEIEEAYNAALKTINQSRYNLSEILLLIDTSADEEKTIDLANEIVSQLRGGADFNAMAREFSNATSAAQGGRLGWLAPSQLEPKIEHTAQALKDGEISEPFRTNAGIRIILRNSFQKSGGIDSNKNLYDLLVLSFDAENQSLTDHLSSTKENFKTCKQAEQDAVKHGAIEAQRTGQRELGSFMPALGNILSELEAGEISASVRTDKSIDLIVVCDQKDDQGRSITRDQIENNIYQQKMSMMSRRHMRELRRDAVIEYR